MQKKDIEIVNLHNIKWESTRKGQRIVYLSSNLKPPKCPLKKNREETSKPKFFNSFSHSAKAYADYNIISLFSSSLEDHQSLLLTINDKCSDLDLTLKPKKIVYNGKMDLTISFSLRNGSTCNIADTLWKLLGALGAFEGNLNPLTGRAIYEPCGIPILLYGCNNRILTETNIASLESFQNEICRRVLKLSKFYSLLATQLALQYQSITSCLLFQKLSLLVRVSSGNESIRNKIFSTLTPENPHHLSLVQEYVSLEDKIGCKDVT